MRISDWSSDVCSSDLRLSSEGAAARRATIAPESWPRGAVPRLLPRAALHRILPANSCGGRKVAMLRCLSSIVVLSLLAACAGLQGPAMTTTSAIVPDEIKGQMRAGESDLAPDFRSEEHTSELQSLMRISYAVFCLKKKTQ